MGMVLFGLALDIPEKEMEKSLELARPGMMVVALQNDYFSYDKEQKAALRDGKKEAMNGISTLMREQSVALDEGKRLMRQEINKRAVEYKKRVEEARLQNTLSEGSLRYSEAVLYTISGQPLWCMECLRYHAKEEPNERQLDLIKQNFPELTGTVSENGQGGLAKDHDASGPAKSTTRRTALVPAISV
jgi:hypothetical protein